VAVAKRCQRRKKKKMAGGEDKREFEVDRGSISRKVIKLPCTKTSRAIIAFGTPILSTQSKQQKKAKSLEELSQKYNFSPSYLKQH